jgi:hypothetical protein
MDETTDRFLDALDEFARGLSSAEQSLLRVLLDEEPPEVSGFGADGSWPGVRLVAGPDKMAMLLGTANPFLSSGHTTGSNVVKDPISSGDLGSGR